MSVYVPVAHIYKFFTLDSPPIFTVKSHPEIIHTHNKTPDSIRLHNHLQQGPKPKLRALKLQNMLKRCMISSKPIFPKVTAELPPACFGDAGKPKSSGASQKKNKAHNFGGSGESKLHLNVGFKFPTKLTPANATAAPLHVAATSPPTKIPTKMQINFRRFKRA